MTVLRRSSGDTFRSLRIRNFRLFFGGQIISEVGNWITRIAQTLFVLQLTDSGVALGLLAAAQFGPVLLFGAFAGLVADRSDKRVLFMWVQAFAMAQSFALAFLAFAGHPPILAIYAVALMGGITTAFDNPVRRSFVVELVPEEDISNAVGLNSALMTSARVFGPALGGILVVTVGFGWAFVIDALSYLVVIGAFWLMDPTAIRRSPAAPRGKGQVREGLRYVATVPDLWIPLVMVAIVGTMAFNLNTVLPLFTTRDLGGTDFAFTILMSVLSIGSVIGALLAARRTTVTVQLVSWAAIAFGVTTGLLAVAGSYHMALVIAVLVGLSSTSFMAAATAITQLRADPVMRGRVLALQAIVFLGSTPIGAPIVGTISQHAGARYGLAIGAASAVAAGVLGMVAMRHQTAAAAATA